MTILLREQILEAMSRPDPDERLVITPLLDRDVQIGPGSIDLRLGTEFLESTRQTAVEIDPFDDHIEAATAGRTDSKTFVPLADRFVIHPGQFVLGCTLEFLQLPANLAGQVVSRSSWGRLGLLVATAVAVQPGFKGVLTLELVNTGNIPIVLRPGVRVAQLLLWAADAPTADPYGGDRAKYSAPLGPESNRLALEASERQRLERIADEIHSRKGYRGRNATADDDIPTTATDHAEEP
ncbi:dCTP deaminase [Microbacterium panaciterrae]|uniref:dCTP deaminase n=1 Tax=Microbacterium panaciterrae TaxID=985759 RepID=A0ABP8P3E0_9MICO